MVVFPLVWLVFAAFKSTEDFYVYTFMPVDWPVWQWGYVQKPWAYFSDAEYHFTLANFESLFGQMNYGRFLMNSLFVSSCTVMIQFFFSSLGGFALAKYEFAGKRVVIVTMLITLMIPVAVLMAPMYELIYRLGFMDSHLGLIIPGMVSVFGVFLFRQSMLSIPDDLLEAARVDGCSEFGLYWQIVLPVCRPMVGAFYLIAFMGSWNSFLWPQIILQTMEKFTLPIGLQQMIGIYKQDYGALMAGTLLSILPVVLLFFLLQKEFIAGLTSGAVKG